MSKDEGWTERKDERITLNDGTEVFASTLKRARKDWTNQHPEYQAACAELEALNSRIVPYNANPEVYLTKCIELRAQIDKVTILTNDLCKKLDAEFDRRVGVPRPV